MTRFVDVSHGSMATERQRGIILSMLYTAADGIWNDDLCIISPQPILRFLLPLQSMLYEHFDLHPKYITEGENNIKRLLNNMNSTDMSKLKNRLQHLPTFACKYTSSNLVCTCHDECGMPSKREQVTE